MSTIESSAASDVALGVRSIADLRREDIAFAGGKGANLGELTGAGFPVPPGFVIGAPAYAAFIEGTGLGDRLAERLGQVDVDDAAGLETAAGEIQAMVEAEPIPATIAEAIRSAYTELVGSGVPVAVRSSATAEDTEAASFAGMNETFLNVRGAEAVLDAVRRCWSSLFGARTIFYRAKRGFELAGMEIAVVVQRQIPATRAGVMFTVDPATGATDRLVIEGSFGLGEAVVSGRVSPDRYAVDKETLSVVIREIHPKKAAIEPHPAGGTMVHELAREEALRPTLGDDQARALAQTGKAVEAHYEAPQDIEWAIDADGKIWLLQSRPVTAAGGAEVVSGEHKGEVLLRGLGAGPGAAAGPVRILGSLAEAGNFVDGAVLVTRMTAPDWVPLMRRAAAIATDSGGVTCHAAIVSRELGIPCVVGTQEATKKLRDDETVTVDATRGIVLEGVRRAPAAAPENVVSERVSALPAATATSLLLNLSEPSQAEHAAGLDVDGVGLLRAELMVIEALEGKHPRLLLDQGRGAEFVERMGDGLTTFAGAFAPRPITYRTIDFRTNEFRGLEGGDQFEPEEANPMIGVRGALRYIREPELFGLELEAVRRVWDAGHTNLHVMLPFVRTAAELAHCRELVESLGPPRPDGVRALGHGRGPLGPLQPRTLRRPRRRRHLHRLERPHAARPRRRPRLRAARRGLRRAGPGGHRLPVAADPASPASSV